MAGNGKRLGARIAAFAAAYSRPATASSACSRRGWMPWRNTGITDIDMRLTPERVPRDPGCEGEGGVSCTASQVESCRHPRRRVIFRDASDRTERPRRTGFPPSRGMTGGRQTYRSHLLDCSAAFGPALEAAEIAHVACSPYPAAFCLRAPTGRRRRSKRSLVFSRSNALS